MKYIRGSVSRVNKSTFYYKILKAGVGGMEFLLDRNARFNHCQAGENTNDT